MATLYSYDYELQRDVIVQESPTIDQVAFYVKNGDVIITEALRWCRESGISISDFKKALNKKENCYDI